MDSERISQRIENFKKRFGEAHLYLAYHAAFPLALTPDLAYRIWLNFQRDNTGNVLKSEKGRVLQIPWIAVADLLLSNLCEEVAHELYEMEQEVRNELLKRMRGDERFGKLRIHKLSRFLLEYIKDELNSYDPYVRNFANAQKWVAMAYVEPDKVARDLAEALSSRIKKNDKAGILRVASLAKTIAEPLLDASFEYLIIYSKCVEKFVQNDIKGTKNQTEKILEEREDDEFA
ncbi:MAG: hypothetical protein GY795_50975 [Desulfobacterales bacterium]|nr:hypothetical protein [Desulfobacterales bacterium]